MNIMLEAIGALVFVAIVFAGIVTVTNYLNTRATRGGKEDHESE